LDRNQRQEHKERSKEFYLQRSERKGHTERHVAGPGIQVRLNARFYGFFVASGGVCFSLKILA
jgi:hypothetical protein